MKGRIIPASSLLRRMSRGTTIFAAAVMLPATLCSTPAAQASSRPAGSTIIWNCGKGQTICAYNPVTRRHWTLQHHGTVAGITSNGKTYGYVVTANKSISLYTAPVNGGKGQLVGSNDSWNAGTVQLSPNGKYYLASGIMPYFDGTSEINEQWLSKYRISAGPKSNGTIIDVDNLDAMTFGWTGAATPVVADGSNAFNPPTWVCVNPQMQAGHGCTQGLLNTDSYILTFPAGSLNGQELIVAEGTQSGSAEGQTLALVNAKTGRSIGKRWLGIKSGYGFSTARFSPNGKQVVVEADTLNSQGDPTGTGTIYIADPSEGTVVREVGRGSNAFWGGA